MLSVNNNNDDNNTNSTSLDLVALT